MKKCFYAYAVLFLFLPTSFCFGQVDSISNVKQSSIQETLIRQGGKHIQSAGKLYNISTAIAFAGSTIGVGMIINGDPQAGSIITTASGLVASVLQIVANTNLYRGGQKLNLLEENLQLVDDSNLKSISNGRSRHKSNISSVSLELRPALSSRNKKRGDGSRTLEQYFLGGTNLKYSLNEYFLRLGICTGITRGSTGDISTAPFYSSLAGSIGFGTRVNANEVSIGGNIFSQYGEFNFVNFEYVRYFTDNLGCGIGLNYDYDSGSRFWNNRFFPSVNLTYNIPTGSKK